MDCIKTQEMDESKMYSVTCTDTSHSFRVPMIRHQRKEEKAKKTMAHEDVEESERDERDEEELAARVRGLLSGDRSEGRGGGGYSSLLTPSGIENAKTDAVRFGG